jgi:hypothetical protein
MIWTMTTLMMAGTHRMVTMGPRGNVAEAARDLTRSLSVLMTAVERVTRELSICEQPSCFASAYVYDH